MRVCFLVHELSRSGGVDVILGHARALAEDHGAAVDVAITGPGGLEAAGIASDLAIPIEEALGREYDVAIGTWWETAEWLFEVIATRRVFFLQSFERRFYRREEVMERSAAALIQCLPVGFIVISEWMRGLLAELRPDASCAVVPNGIDKSVFREEEIPDGMPEGNGSDGADMGHKEEPLRILIEGQPTLWFKGVVEALEAVGRMSLPRRVTLVALDADGFQNEHVDEVASGLGPSEMAALYRRHDVLVKLSRVEGLGLAPLEGFHCGLPCVVTPYTGHEDYVMDGENGLVVPFDDVTATAEALDRLAADRRRLGRLAGGALTTAERWPGREDSAHAFAEALQGFAEQEAPDPAPALRRLMHHQRLALELGRIELEETRGAFHWHEDAWREAVHKMEDSERRLEEIKASRAYRLAERARSVYRLPRR